MLRRPPEEKLGLPLSIAAGGHLLLIALLALHFSWHQYEPMPLVGELLEAPTIDISEVKKIQREVKQRKTSAAQAEQQRERDEELKRIKELEAEAERQQVAEQQRVAEEQAREEVRRQEDEAKRVALEKKKKQEEIEQKAELEKKRKAEEEKKRKAKEEQAKKDAEAKKKKEAEEKKAKAEAEKKKKEADAKRRAAQEAELEEQMEAEAQASAARRQQVLSEVDKYKALIYNKVKRNWFVPANPNGDCRIEVRLGPGGMVLDVSDGYGDAVLCRSAVAAVRKAEPLPVPEDPEVFDEMRVINFKMDPKDATK